MAIVGVREALEALIVWGAGHASLHTRLNLVWYLKLRDTTYIRWHPSISRRRLRNLNLAQHEGARIALDPGSFAHSSKEMV